MKQKNVLLGLLFLLVSSISVNPMELAKITDTKAKNFKEITSIRSRQELGLLKLLHDGKDFYVKDNESTKPVARHFLDKPLKEMKFEHLEKFQKHGYIDIKRLSSGEYKLNTHVRGNGGGMWTGLCAYYGTKVVGYVGYGVACAYDPELALHYFEITAAIETTAQAAGYIGTVSPTP